MAFHTGSLPSLRERNRKLVVDSLLARGAASRADIARETGLSRTTVSSLVADLQSAGLVVERADAGASNSTRQGGRPPVFVSLDRSAGAIVGLDFAHDHVRAAVADLSYTVLAEAFVELDVDTAAGEALDAAARMVPELLEEAGVEAGSALAAGMALSVPIDAGRMVHSRVILPSWVDLDPAAEMERRLGIPVHVDNDANLGALGESTFGSGRDSKVMAYLRIAAGIGAGFVIDGQLFRGAGGIAGEVGHVMIDPNGPMCRCGNRGCLETLAAPPALCDLLRNVHGDLTVPEMLARAEDGDAGCRRVLAEAGEVVGRALADLCNYLNPDLIVIGGELSPAGELILAPMRESVRRYAIGPAADGVEVVVGTLGERAELLGSLALAAHAAKESLAAPLSQLSQLTEGEGGK